MKERSLARYRLETKEKNGVSRKEERGDISRLLKEDNSTKALKYQVSFIFFVKECLWVLKK
jgi:hypothetical protein